MIVLALCFITVFSVISAHAAEMAAEPAVESTCHADADCWDGSSLYCEGSLDCSARDSMCPFIDGYVECDSHRTSCPSCPGCPIEGAMCFDNDDCVVIGDPDCESCFCKAPLPYGEGFCHCV
jgi:hypothetical protein